MRKSKFSEEQIIGILREAEGETPIKAVCARHNISEPAFYKWRRKFGGFDEIPLTMGADRHRVSLLRLAPGRGLPVHRHKGEEYTVVLHGGFTDSTGNYGPGDFAFGPGDNEHEPSADAGDPCIALIVLDNPIVLTGPVGRFLNPLVRRGLI